MLFKIFTYQLRRLMERDEDFDLEDVALFLSGNPVKQLAAIGILLEKIEDCDYEVLERMDTVLGKLSFKLPLRYQATKDHFANIVSTEIEELKSESDSWYAELNSYYFSTRL